MRLIAYAVAPMIAGTCWVVPAAAGQVNCRIVTDARGDTLSAPQGTTAAPGSTMLPADPSLDVVSADVAGNRQVVTAVIRIASLGQTAQTSPVASAYLLSFAANEHHYTLYAMRDVNGPDRFLLLDVNETVSTNGVNVNGHFDTAHSEVRITAPYTAFTELGGRISSSTSAYEIQAYTQRAIGSAGSYTFQDADGAAGTRSVRLGATSCVRPGH